MKKFICLLLSLVLLTSILSSCNDISDTNSDINVINNATETATDTISTNTEGKEELKSSPASDFKYKFSEDNERVFITQYIGTSKNVVIPSKIEGRTVTSLIGYQVDDFLHGVFQDTDIETVIIPNTIKVMGSSTFKDCTFLYSVTIKPNSELLDIGNEAFRSCSSLRTINLGDAENLKAIGSYAFENCSSIKEIYLPQNLTEIGKGTFAYCTSLKSATIPPKLNLMFIEESAFHNVPSLEQIVFNEGREKITGYAFIQTDANIHIVVPTSIVKFSPGPFLINPSSKIKITFLGDAPEIVEDDTDWFGNPTIYYDPNTNGWDNFAWNNKFNIKPIQ